MVIKGGSAASIRRRPGLLLFRIGDKLGSGNGDVIWSVAVVELQRWLLRHLPMFGAVLRCGLVDLILGCLFLVFLSSFGGMVGDGGVRRRSEFVLYFTFQYNPIPMGKKNCSYTPISQLKSVQ